MRHLLAGTSQDDLLNRIHKSDSDFSGLLPSLNALRKLRSTGLSSTVTPHTLNELVKELGTDTVVHYQLFPKFLLVIQTMFMVSKCMKRDPD